MGLGAVARSPLFRREIRWTFISLRFLIRLGQRDGPELPRHVGQIQPFVMQIADGARRSVRGQLARGRGGKHGAETTCNSL